MGSGDFTKRGPWRPALACAALLALSGCVQPVPGGYPPPGPALSDQAHTIDLENADRIARFRNLAASAGTNPPLIDQLYAPAGTVPGVPTAVPVVRVVFAEHAFFNSGSDEPRPEADAYFDLIAENMKHDVPDVALTLLGHTDATGSDALNMSLSERRAAAVMAALIARGVPPSQLGTIAIGKAQPIAPNITAAGRARNRRVEFMISGTEAANLSVVTHRQTNAAYFKVAVARPAAPPPLEVALLKPDRAPSGPTDLSFLKKTETLSLAAPRYVEPPSENSPVRGHAPSVIEPPAEGT